MKKIFKNIIIITTVLMMVATLVGCGNTEDQVADPINIAFVLGIADDETVINTGIEELTAIPSLPGTDYAFISAEEEPTLIGDTGTVPDLSDRGYNEAMMDRVQAGIQADLTSHLNSFTPTSAEIDIAAATEMAVRTLNANAVEGRSNYLVYYCGGKSTTGLINMIETPVYKMDIEASTTAVAEQMNIDMSQLDIIWYCCGDFGDKQPELTTTEKEELKSFYKQIFTKLGAKSVTFKDNLPSAECYHFEDIPVSCMEVEETKSGLEELVALNPEIFEDDKTEALTSPIVIPEEQIRFKPDTSDFLDPDAAVEAIQPVANYMLSNPSLSILLYGTCAGDQASELGRTRAETVKALLVNLGVDGNRITATTVSPTDDPYYEFGLGTGSEGAVNRKVVLLDMETELAQQILSQAF